APSARASVLEVMARALEITPGVPSGAGSGDAFSLADAMREAVRLAARVVVISDFLDETDAVLALGRTFGAAGGELYAVHIVDRGELDPDPTTLLVEDPEAAAVRRPMSPTTRAT